MTPRVQELLDRLREERARRPDEIPDTVIETKVRERIIVEKFDHEIAEVPVLVETVEVVLLDGRPIDQRVIRHEPPQQLDSAEAS